jgi:hypothetical protein
MLPDPRPGEQTIRGSRRSPLSHKLPKRERLPPAADIYLIDGASRARTDDLYRATVALSQLSYSPEVGQEV